MWRRRPYLGVTYTGKDAAETADFLVSQKCILENCKGDSVSDEAEQQQRRTHIGTTHSRLSPTVTSQYNLAQNKFLLNYFFKVFFF